MSALHAARVAAQLKKALGVPVEKLSGRYGEFTVLVDGEPILDAGSLGWLGILPSTAEVLEAVLRADDSFRGSPARSET